MGVGGERGGCTGPLSDPHSLPLQVQGPQQLQPLQQPPKLPNLVTSCLPAKSAPLAHPITRLSGPLLWGLAAPSGCHILSLGLLTHLFTCRSVGGL